MPMRIFRMIVGNKVATPVAVAVLFVISCRTTPLFGQSGAPASQLAPIVPTISLGEPMRSTKLESDNPEMRYQNGFFFNADNTGHMLIRNKDGHLIGDFNLQPQVTSKAYSTPFMHDVAIFKDGSMVASWLYSRPHDSGSNRYFDLVHYDQAGNFIEQIDLGKWRATKICVADDKSVWTLSGEEDYGHPVYSPDEGVLRKYRFGEGLVSAVVPRSNFQPNNTSSFPNYAVVHAAIDCSGDKVHVLTGDGKWIEYTPQGDFTITPIEPFSHSSYGDFWRMIGFAYLEDGHAYAVIHSLPGDPFRRMFAELLPSADGKSLRWVEVPSEKTLPANNQPSDPTHPTDKPKEPIVVTGVLGADHEDGEQIVYRTSKDETILWSKPLLGSSGSH